MVNQIIAYVALGYIADMEIRYTRPTNEYPRVKIAHKRFLSEKIWKTLTEIVKSKQWLFHFSLSPMKDRRD